MGRIYRERTTRRTLANMDRQIKVQGSASHLALSGLSVPEEGVTQVDGTLHVLGDFIADGKISNDALMNPIRGDAALDSASGFSLNTTGTVPLVSQSWFVPEGFTKAHIYITGRVFAYNSTAGVDYLFARSRAYVPSSDIAIFGNGFPVAATGSNGSAFNVSPVGLEFLNLSDGLEIRLEVQGWTAFATWAASAGNIADVAGQITWTR
jgi:hypothetical protein